MKNRGCLLLIVVAFVLVALFDRPEDYSFAPEVHEAREVSQVKKVLKIPVDNAVENLLKTCESLCFPRFQ